MYLNVPHTDDGALSAQESTPQQRPQRSVGGMFGALTSVLARECRSVVTGRMAGALFAGESNSLGLEQTVLCRTWPCLDVAELSALEMCLRSCYPSSQ